MGDNSELYRTPKVGK